MTGPDVQELNADLVALGYVTSAELSPTSDQFGYWTKAGVEKLQAALGVAQNGTLALGQVVVPADRGSGHQQSRPPWARPPAPGQPVMSATSTTRQVSIALDADQQSEVAVGDKVTITLPDNQSTPGVISSVGTVATVWANSRQVRQLTDHHGAGEPDRPGRHRNLGSGPGRGVDHHRGRRPTCWWCPSTPFSRSRTAATRWRWWGPSGIHRLVPVSLGLFDDADGMVQVTGSGLAAGQRVVVPAL